MARRDSERNPDEQRDVPAAGDERVMPGEDVRGVGDEEDEDFDAEDADDEEDEDEEEGSF